MLKTVSAITNAIGALNYKGTWNANTNSPALASGVGTKGDYYVVGTAGTTTLDGISNWGIGDWAVFNGSVWQRVEGGADLNGVNLSVSGTSTLSALTASTALALNGSKEVVSVTNTGSGNNVLATSPSIATPTLTGDVQLSTGNIVVGASGKGIDFSADPHTGGMTGELLNDYEEGTWTPFIDSDGAGAGRATTVLWARYTKIGRVVTCNFYAVLSTLGSGGSGSIVIRGLPFTPAEGGDGFISQFAFFNSNVNFVSLGIQSGNTRALLLGTSAPDTITSLLSFATFAKATTQFGGCFVYTV